MIQFLLELVRGVLIGLLCGYMIRPEAEIYSKIGNAVENGGHIVEESYFDLLMQYAPEYLVMDHQFAVLLISGTIGALLGTVFWLMRKKTSAPEEVAVKKRKTPAPKKRKRQQKQRATQYG
jgi:hypothetical protein